MNVITRKYHVRYSLFGLLNDNIQSSLCCSPVGHYSHNWCVLFLSVLIPGNELCYFWMVDVSRRASYKITLVGLFVRLFVCPSPPPSLIFLKIGSLVFSNIVNDDRCPWYLVTDEARFLRKKKLVIRIWARN